MKRLLSVFITLVLLLGIIPFGIDYSAISLAQQPGREKATFIAVTLKKVGYDIDGTKLIPERYFPWEYTKGSSWGRKEIKMPAAPLYWAEIYLTINAEGGKSKPENRWVVVMDATGNLWFDPDGNFHNSNYDVFSDPENPAFIPGRCSQNQRALYDPLSNTQGPYVLDSMSSDYKSSIFFWDKLTTGKGWRIGWIDMVDYPAKGSILPDGTTSSGLVNQGDWDIELVIEKFVNNGDDIADEGEEWHTENVLDNGYYDSGEYIYRLGERTEDPSDPQRNTVHLDDLRLTPVSVRDGESVVTYYIYSLVGASDKDVGLRIVPFQDDGSLGCGTGEEWHLATQLNGMYDVGESIYLKTNGIPENKVQYGDLRLSNVNSRKDNAGLVMDGIYAGDVLVLSPVLEANCNGSKLDLSVETDVWISANPSVTAARLFSPTGDITEQVQKIQKSTVLDPDGKSFYVPATTFSDVKLDYREYIGVEIFADNGIDNNLGVNLSSDKLYAQNLSSDYRAGRTGEEFLGAINGNYAFDYGRVLTSFPEDNLFYDVGENGFGCGETIYKKAVFNIEATEYFVDPGDCRLTDVTLQVNGQRFFYQAGSYVTMGDPDVGFPLTKIPSEIKFFDDEYTGVVGSYDSDEPIYLSADEITGPGDKRFTEIEFGGKVYLCNSELENPDFWFRESPIHMTSMGFCGDGKCIDITVLPGKLDLDVQIDKPFKVEQTSEVNIKLKTKLKDGDKVQIVLKEPTAPSFAGIPPEPPTLEEEIVPHEWIEPPDDTTWENYRLSPRPYNPVLRHDETVPDTYAGDTPPYYHWSDPTTELYKNSWYYSAQNGPVPPSTRGPEPACGPAQGPYAWTLPNEFKFPFFNRQYQQIWVYPSPAIRLSNKKADHFRIIDNSNSEYNRNVWWGRHIAELIIDPNMYSTDVPELCAYGDYYVMISPVRYQWYPPDAYNYPNPGTVYPGYGLWVGGLGGYGGAVTGYHHGWYHPNIQVKSNGVFAFVDETVSPKRCVITWIVNFSYDVVLQQGHWGTPPVVAPGMSYAPYRVQIVLYEDGTFQYNYDGGNKYWSNAGYTNAGPAVGWFAKTGVGAQARLLPHHMNRDLTNAPSVRFKMIGGVEKMKAIETWTSYVDYRELDNKNPEATFNYTPYRGTCNEDGTRTRLELIAYLDRGGIRYPIPLDPGEKNTKFEKWDIPVGVAAGDGRSVYVDMDENSSVSAGDIRLTSVTRKGMTYAIGSVVKEGDTDWNWINDQDEQGWGIFDPDDARLGGAVYDDGTLIVYVDVNGNGIANINDIRLVAFNGYTQGSVVSQGDWEVSGRTTVLFPVDAPVGIIGDNVYWDRDWSMTVSKYDIRLTAIDAYRSGTRVVAGEFDVGTQYKVIGFPVGIYDPIPADPNNEAIGYHVNVYGHLSSYDDKRVVAGDIRMSDCYLQDPLTLQWYVAFKAGSIVRENDPDHGLIYTWYDPPIFMWDNDYIFGVYADIDGSSVPPQTYAYYRAPTYGDVRIAKNIWKKLPYVYSYYKWTSFDPGTLIYSPWNKDYPPVYKQFDTYYSSYYSTTFASGITRVDDNISLSIKNNAYINISPISSAVKPGDYRLTDTGKLFQGTVVEIDSPDRQSNYLFDPYWAKVPWTKLELDENPFRALKPIPEVQPYDLMPSNVYNGYDCYYWEKYDIVPEDLILETDKKCIDLYPQRFPNVTIKVSDADNPNDVNDPANVAFSSKGDKYKEPLWMNFNAHGGGIKFFFTAVAEPPSYQKYIGEYLEDDTVVFWYWYDNEPYGVFDANDFLKSTYDVNKSGYFKPVGLNASYPYYISAPPFPARINDIDCSFGQTVCQICGDETGFPKLGEVNNRFYNFSMMAGDLEGHGIWYTGDKIINTLGLAPSFDSTTTDPQIVYCPSQGDKSGTSGCSPRRYGTIWTYGVPIQLTSWSKDDEGGRITLPVKPFNTDTPVKIRLYSSRVLYDYNSKYPHGPAFILDTAPGIDYCGTLDLKVLQPDPKVNFGEFTIIDHSLQNSKVNYTSGTGALSPMAYPTPLIHADYDPLLINYKREFRAYPGGQTHTGRIPNNEEICGFNSYKALWSDMYSKLGTEMFPFSDYGIYFVLYDGLDRKVWWNTSIPYPSRNLKSITIEGPFMRPKVFERIGGAGSVTQSYKSTYPDNLPVQYDYSGKIVIDTSNYSLYSTFYPPDLTAVASPLSVDSYSYATRNQRLVENRKLWFYGTFIRPDNNVNLSEYMVDWEFMSTRYTPYYQMVHIIDEIIPISQGKLTITVELYDGTVKKYQDCCTENYEDIPINGLSVDTNISNIALDTDTKLSVDLKEYDTKSYPPSEHIIPCNDALVLVWQDRGVKDAGGRVTGAGDGWITVPPRASTYTSSHKQVNEWFDINNDGKVSFADYETEIIGTYDMATNTWSSGVIDGRTFQRNDGIYTFNLTSENGALVDTIGYDFGGPVSINNLPDHVIDDYELLNVNITAFKFGDDNNDRAFTPLYSLTRPYEFSHEVYLAGHKAIPVVPKTDLVVDFSPQPLTAGCVPELLEDEKPLTITVLDSEGKPVDLSVGVPDASGEREVTDECIWNVLFKDPHPETLPQYYWVRTDLHNDDGTMINNYRLYSFPRNTFLPISVDFTDKSQGIYMFNGFCANDEGSFDLYVSTPDRRHNGVTRVKVELPKARYLIKHRLISDDFYKQQGGPLISEGADTDFIMTAANLSLYYVTAEVRDARGNLIRGEKTKEQLGGRKLTRFTPYTTKPDNFNYYNMSGPDAYRPPEVNRYVRIFTSQGSRYTNSALLPAENADVNYIIYYGGFQVRYLSSWTSSWSGTRGITYYNTTNWQWEDGTWELYPVWDLPPANQQRGWGRGAIYNSPHKGGYLFPDWGGGVIDGALDFTDSLSIDENGQSWAPLGANDIGEFGGLIGKNPYSTQIFGDVAGGMWNFRVTSTNPGDIRYRFNQYLNDTTGWTNADGTFKLDWDAFPNHDAKIMRPRATVFNATDGELLGSKLIDPNNYDLIYGKTNYLRVRIAPAGSPDFPILPDGTLILADDAYFPDDVQKEGKAEDLIWATTQITGGGTDLLINGTTEGELMLTPTGSYKDVAQLKYYGFRADWNGNRYIRDSIGKVWHLADFDVIRALKVVAKTGKELYAGEKDTLNVYVYEVGTEKPVSGADVEISGVGLKLEGKTDKNGLVSFEVLPKERGVISINVYHSSYGEGYTEVAVKEAKEAAEILIEIEPLPSLTKELKIKVVGSTNSGYKVTINDKTVTVREDGKFEMEVELIEGPNTIIIVVEDNLGRSAKKMFTVVRDTTGPAIFVDEIPQLVDIREYTLKGRIEKDSTLEVNGKAAMVNGEEWEATISLDYGENKVLLLGKDKLGNETKKELIVIVYHKVEVKLAIGSLNMIVNGVSSDQPLSVAPYIKEGKTFVPLRVISEALGAKVEWLPDVKGIVIEFMGKKIEMQVGSKRAVVNGKVVDLDTPPEITNGVTFVPIRFVADMLGAEVKWLEETKEIIITILVY